MPDEPSLSSIIIAQSTGTVGVPVLLFTSETIGAETAGDDQPPGHAEELMARLGQEAGQVELFSTDAYVLQTALGVELLPGEL